jgi:hypothetical protein
LLDATQDLPILDLWQAHMKAPHLADYVAATEGAVLNVTLNELAQIA